MALRRRLPPALRHRDYALYWASIVPTAFSEQMVVVAVGWQVYAIHRSAFDLGLIGLMAFVPMPLLALPAGHLADRVPRSRVLALSYLVQLAVAALLLVVTVEGARALWPFLLLALATGAGIALGAPAGRALSPSLVPLELVQSAVTLRSIAFQASIVGGPALGGALFALSPRVVYVTAAALALVGVGCIAAVRDPVRERGEGGATLDTLLAGVRFIRSTSSPSSSAGPRRCCRCSPAPSSTRARSASASCAAPRRRARCSPGSCSRAGRSQTASAGRCSSPSPRSGRAWSSSGSRARCRSPASRSPSAASPTCSA